MKRVRIYFPLILAAVCAAQGSIMRAESVASRVKKGNLRYTQKEYEQALQLYNEALLEEPDRQELIYNLANTFYRLGKYQEASKELARVTNQPKKSQARFHYNLGNAFYKNKQFREAAQQYMTALKKNPGDVDSKYNLELALKAMEKQDQSRKDSKKKSQEKKDRDKSGKKPQQSGKNQDQKPQNQDRASKSESRGQNAQRPDPRKAEDRGQSRAQPKGLSRQDAERLLQAMESKEKKELVRQLQKVRRKAARGRDW